MEEKDIKIIEKYINFNEISGTRNFKEAIEKLLQAYKQDEKVIEEMAKHFEGYEINDLITLNNQKETIDYFRKKCE